MTSRITQYLGNAKLVHTDIWTCVEKTLKLFNDDPKHYHVLLINERSKAYGKGNKAKSEHLITPYALRVPLLHFMNTVEQTCKKITNPKGLL